jgi:hypothetical protein
MVAQEDVSFNISLWQRSYSVSHHSFTFFDGHTWFGHQGADRTNSNTSQTRVAPRLSQRYAGHGTNHSINAPESKIKNASAFLMTYPNAFAAYNTLIGIIGE